jgi:hypothetical protein
MKLAQFSKGQKGLNLRSSLRSLSYLMIKGSFWVMSPNSLDLVAF